MPVQEASHIQAEQSLYDRDFILWVEITAQLLKEQKFTELDLVL